MSLPYAFGPVHTPNVFGWVRTIPKEGQMVKYYIMPYAFGLNDDGTVDTETKVRLDQALCAANEKKGNIFLGAGMYKYAQKKGAISLSYSAYQYLIEKGVSKDKIKDYADGYNTMTETLAFWQYVSLHDQRDAIIEAATSWWHVPRVWAVCRIIFGRSIKVHAVRSTHSSLNIVYDMVREIAAFSRSVFIAAVIMRFIHQQENHGVRRIRRKEKV